MFTILPRDILPLIFDYLTLRDRLSCEETCKTFYRSINERDDSYFHSLAEKVNYFCRRDGAIYFREKSKIKERFAADYRDILRDARIRRISCENPVEKGVNKICWLMNSTIGKNISNQFYNQAIENQFGWESLLPLFKVGVLYEHLDKSLFLFVYKIFASKELRDQAYETLFLYHQFVSKEEDSILLGKAAYYASKQGSEQAKDDLLETGNETSLQIFSIRNNKRKTIQEVTGILQDMQKKRYS